MPQIKDIMTPNCLFVTPDTTLQEAATIMLERDLGFLPVGENDRLIGMITDRDITIRATAKGENPTTATVRSVMSPKTYYCFEDQSSDEICSNMSDIKVRRLPVVNRDKRLVGVVSLGDLAQAEQANQIGQTEQQITSALSQQRKAA